MWNLWKSNPEKQIIRKIVECTRNGTLRWERQETKNMHHIYQADGGNIKFVWSFFLDDQQLTIDGVTVCTSWKLLLEVYREIRYGYPLKAETIQRFLDRFTEKTESSPT